MDEAGATWRRREMETPDPIESGVDTDTTSRILYGRDTTMRIRYGSMDQCVRVHMHVHVHVLSVT